MSSTKAALNPRIKISKTGRPYVETADLVKSELDRIQKSQERTQSGSASNQASAGNGVPAATNDNSSNGNNSNSRES